MRVYASWTGSAEGSPRVSNYTDEEGQELVMLTLPADISLILPKGSAEELRDALSATLGQPFEPMRRRVAYVEIEKEEAMVTVTDLAFDRDAVTVEAYRVDEAIKPWFEDPSDEVRVALEALQQALDRGDEQGAAGYAEYLNIRIEKG